jgi:hypothetical protein
MAKFWCRFIVVKKSTIPILLVANTKLVRNKKGQRFNLCPLVPIASAIAVATTAVAILSAFATGFGRLFTIIGEVATAVMAALLACFRRFFAVICKVARIFVCHVLLSSMDKTFCGTEQLHQPSIFQSGGAGQ